MSNLKRELKIKDDMTIVVLQSAKTKRDIQRALHDAYSHIWDHVELLRRETKESTGKPYLIAEWPKAVKTRPWVLSGIRYELLKMLDDLGVKDDSQNYHNSPEGLLDGLVGARLMCRDVDIAERLSEVISK